MNDRPANLPDYDAPPVTEVVLGIQFDALQKVLAAHHGMVWRLFESRFVAVEEHPALSPTFELFGPNPGVPSHALSFLLPFGGGPRSFFINHDRTELLQFQRDRFLHNWRKVGDENTYPRFERMLDTFRECLEKLEGFVGSANLGTIRPNQCEISYINQIEIDENISYFDMMALVFDRLLQSSAKAYLGSPEDARISLRYIMRDEDSEPIGRLIVNAEPAIRPDGSKLIQLNLTARGAPQSPSLDGAFAFLKAGRIAIVNTFTEITSAKMHERWRRQQ